MRKLFAAVLCLLAMPGLAAAQTKLKAGMVTGIDQIGLPIALERGFFEKQGLDVTIARPYATGVDALNALTAGESEIVAKLFNCALNRQRRGKRGSRKRTGAAFFLSRSGHLRASPRRVEWVTILT